MAVRHLLAADRPPEVETAMKIKRRRMDLLKRIKANQEIDRCRKMTPDQLLAFLRAKYEKF